MGVRLGVLGLYGDEADELAPRPGPLGLMDRDEADAVARQSQSPLGVDTRDTLYHCQLGGMDRALWRDAEQELQLLGSIFGPVKNAVDTLTYVSGARVRIGAYELFQYTIDRSVFFGGYGSYLDHKANAKRELD